VRNMTGVSPDLPGAVTLCPRVPGRGNRIQMHRPHQKGNGDASMGAGIAGGGLPVGGEKGGGRQCPR
jgi:hypothetical protein